ncbi:MAG: TylF/MycF/NovP-related O-methyltransferase [Pseudomonadota bacterium]
MFVRRMFSDWAPPEPSGKVKFINATLKKLGFWVQLQPPLRTGVMTNVEQRMNMYHLLSQVLAYGVEGHVVELGCNEGQSACLMRRILNSDETPREFHVYDSFEGLPAIADKDGDTHYKEGQMAVAKELLLSNFASQNLEPPIIHEGWFDDTLPNELPGSIAFAHLDGDFYDSIKVSLEYVYPRLSKGAICLIDDYADPDLHDGWNDLPGVKNACDEYLADKPEAVELLYAGGMSHGYFRKK